MSSSPALAAGAASHRAQDQRAVRLRTRIAMTVFVALTVVLASIPLATSNISFAFYLMLWITMASAMNICVGFTGYLPFGYVVFYGVGSYATGICYKILGWPIVPSLLAAGGVGVAIALLLAPTLRLRGGVLRHRQPGAGHHREAGHLQPAAILHRRQHGHHPVQRQ